MGQFTPVYSQYIVNGLLINPAYAGSRDVLSTLIDYRNQWAGFPGSVITQTLTAHMPLQNKSVAIGLIVSNESYGLTSNTGVFGNYAYRIRMSTGTLAFGFKAGFELLKENDANLYLENPVDPVFSNNGINNYLPNFGIGVYYFNNKFFAGLSLPEILSYKANGIHYNVYNDVNNYNLMFFGGILINVYDDFKLKPSTLLEYNTNSTFQYNLNLNAILLKDGILSVGASYRPSDAIVGLVEFQLNTQLRIGYSYDYSLSSLVNYSGGTHEITIRYEFKYIVKALNPRFF